MYIGDIGEEKSRDEKFVRAHPLVEFVVWATEAYTIKLVVLVRGQTVTVITKALPIIKNNNTRFHSAIF